MEAGSAQAHQSGQVLTRILQASEQVRLEVEGIAMAADEMKTSANELVGTMDGVSAVAEENTAATEEMAAQVEEVTASAQSLTAMAQDLQELAAQFELTGEGAEPSGELISLEELPSEEVILGHNGHSYEELPLALEFRLMIDASDNLVRESSVDTLYSDEGFIDISEVVEDEIILAIPLVVLHEDSACNEHWQESTNIVESAERENPFAVLQQLKTTD